MLHLYGKRLIVFDNSQPPMFGRMSRGNGQRKSTQTFILTLHFPSFTAIGVIIERPELTDCL